MDVNIKIHDLNFKPFISAQAIADQVDIIAAQITEKYQGQVPFFIVVLKGSYIFAADLVRSVDLQSEVTFVRLASYEGTSSTGNIKTLLGVSEDISNKPVIIIEDIIDSGLTMKHFLKDIYALDPKSVELVTLLRKKDAMKYDIPIDYVGFDIANDFVVGYGLDYNQRGRHLKDIFVLVE